MELFPETKNWQIAVWKQTSINRSTLDEKAKEEDGEMGRKDNEGKNERPAALTGCWPLYELPSVMQLIIIRGGARTPEILNRFLCS